MLWSYQKGDTDLDDFNLNASDQEIVGLMKGITNVSKSLAYPLFMERDIGL